MVGSRPIPYQPAYNPVVGAFEAYQKQKRTRKAEEMADAIYAKEIAELTGKYTPELEQRVLAPMGQEAPVMDQVMGGLGRMVGMDTERGMTQPMSLPGGLKTKYERAQEQKDIEYSRTQKKELDSHLRAIEKDTLAKEKASEIFREETDEGYRKKPFSFEEELKLRQTNERSGDLNTKVGGAKERLMQDIYQGKKKWEDLNEGDFLILRSDWAIREPGETAMDIVKMAQNLTATAFKDTISARKLERAGYTQETYLQKMIDDIHSKVGGLENKIKQGGKEDAELKKIWDIK